MQFITNLLTIKKLDIESSYYFKMELFEYSKKFLMGVFKIFFAIVFLGILKGKQYALFKKWGFLVDCNRVFAIFILFVRKMI